ncbi:MAG: hypothetical protein QM737_15340 [Ferruginibacter sp.]
MVQTRISGIYKTSTNKAMATTSKKNISQSIIFSLLNFIFPNGFITTAQL